MNSEQITAFLQAALGVGDFDHGHCVRGWLNSELELDLRPHRQAGLSPLWPRLPAGDLLPAGCPVLIVASIWSLVLAIEIRRMNDYDD